MALRRITSAGIRMKILQENRVGSFIKKVRECNNISVSSHKKDIAATKIDTEQLKSLKERQTNMGTLRVHCEMQILVFLLNHSNPERFFDHIGCSKCPCWLCHHLLKFVTSKFSMRRSSLKIYAKWQPPEFPEESPNRERVMKAFRDLDELLGLLVKLARWKLLKHHPTRSDNDDVEDTFVSPITDAMRRLEQFTP
ncbi:hypothetical protein GGR52DRAFT_526831 [Hypoxylon sp. FL1284]|nr:hypothetical protein GGR52DRAFT_526831 [Hypoxylon sp. FL1284]